jgi:hypothetical protein
MLHFQHDIDPQEVAHQNMRMPRSLDLNLAQPMFQLAQPMFQLIEPNQQAFNTS